MNPEPLHLDHAEEHDVLARVDELLELGPGLVGRAVLALGVREAAAEQPHRHRGEVVALGLHERLGLLHPRPDVHGAAQDHRVEARQAVDRAQRDRVGVQTAFAKTLRDERSGLLR